MIRIPFIPVPMIALGCYSFLLIALLAAKKTPLIRSFIALLFCFMLWTGGSMFMRLRIWPGYELWYDLSLLSLFATPLFLYLFVHAFVDAKSSLTGRIMAISTVVVLILTEMQVFLKRPIFVYLGNGTGRFEYTLEWHLAIVCIIMGIHVFASLQLVVKAMKESKVASSAMAPFLVGMLILAVGNLASVLPGNIFPFDTLAGIINAMCMLYALYRKRVFKLSLLVSRGTLIMISALLSIVIQIVLTGHVEELIMRLFPSLEEYMTVVVSLIFIVIMVLFYRLLTVLIENLFIKEEVSQAEKLSAFSTAISKSLNLDEIMESLISLVTDTLNVDKAYVSLYNEDSKHYSVAASATPLDVRDFSLSADNPSVIWLKENRSCLVLQEFKRTVAYKGMWEKEKLSLTNLQIGCLVPLTCDDDLVGILAVAMKPKASTYTYEDTTFLDSVRSLVSIAIKNASLYEKAFYESRIDNLTGLYNRKYFYERISAEFESHKSGSLALVILNVDDFKLYNQLYGIREGDIALQRIAAIIQSASGSQGVAARYSGKEFAIVLPEWDTYKAQSLANDILNRVRDLNKGAQNGSMSILTMSGGVCVYPFAASSVKQLVENADMSVYSAKRNGKNKIQVYSIEQNRQLEDQPQEDSNKSYEDYASTIYALTAAIDAKDHYTFSHSNNVADYAALLATALGLNESHVQLIREAGLLHDIGKIGVPEHILTKTEALTQDEYLEMQKHVENSIAMIRHLPSLDYVIPAVLSHHERWDGKGYPRGLNGEDIPVAGRCLAIADSFDAMTSNRPYRKAITAEQAMRELDYNTGTQFDPKIVPVFIELVRSKRITSGSPGGKSNVS